MSLFLPFRALGYITDDVPFAIQRRGKETYITTSVGKSWQIYNANNLRLLLVGPQLPHYISALACKRDLTFAAVHGAIIECKRVHRTGEYRGHGANILQMLVLGDYLLSLGADNKLNVWKIGQYDAPVQVLSLPQGFVPTCMAHPDTYLNKILIGAEDGRLQLWNFATGRCIHEFASAGAMIRCIVPAPALDVVGLGLEDGRVLLHNVRYDERLMEFANAAGAGTNADLFLKNSAARAARLASGGACTTLAFRTGAGVPLMAAGGGAGVVTVWNLEERKLHCTIRDAHDAPLAALHFFAGEPVLLSSAGDNAVKEWIFDGPDGVPRLLRFRSGHAAPPTLVRHYGVGKNLLSGGQDRAFRCFSTIQDAQSRELSQRHTQRRAKRLRVTEYDLKLNRIVALDACDVRERDWSNVITAHEGDSSAYVWRLQRYALGEHVLSPPPKELLNQPPPAPVTAVCLSRCGNFGFVASAAGRLDRYNMQSGLHRGCYRRPALNAHDGAIYGLATDGSNHYVVSTGLDAMLRVWSFSKRTLSNQLSTVSPVVKATLHPATGLFAAACDDLMIRMYDVETLRLVRRFPGHTDRINDLHLSQDCRWLFSASMDNTVRIWDVPGARVLQVLRMGVPVTSLSLAPSQDLLATTHVERKGVYLWANQLVFGAAADVTPSEKPVNARLPSVRTGFKLQSSAHGNEKDLDGTLAGREAAGPRHRVDVKSMLRHSVAAGKNDDDASSDLSGSGQTDVFLEEEEEYSSTSSEDLSSTDSETNDEHNGGDMKESKTAEPKTFPTWDEGIYSRRDAAGGPLPLIPELVTFSMLPRTQWMNLVHLDTIKARNKPIEPPKKPEAAPFFLPTLPEANAGRTPVFQVTAAEEENEADGKLRDAAEAAWNGGADGDDEATAGQPVTRVVFRGGVEESLAGELHHSPFIALLRRCAGAGDYTSLVARLRDMPPSLIDTELRTFRVLEGPEVSDEDMKTMEMWFDFLEAEIASNANFEFVQALLHTTLLVHGDAIAREAVLREAAVRLESRLTATWKRLDGTLQRVRCVIGLLGSMQP